MGSQNPLLYSLLKLRTSVKLARSGVSRSDVASALDQTSGDTIDAVATQAGVAYPTIETAGSQSGGILAALLAFLASPAGQQLEAALVALIIGLISGA